MFAVPVPAVLEYASFKDGSFKWAPVPASKSVTMRGDMLLTGSLGQGKSRLVALLIAIESALRNTPDLAHVSESGLVVVDAAAVTAVLRVGNQTPDVAAPIGVPRPCPATPGQGQRNGIRFAWSGDNRWIFPSLLIAVLTLIATVVIAVLLPDRSLSGGTANPVPQRDAGPESWTEAAFQGVWLISDRLSGLVRAVATRFWPSRRDRRSP